MTENEAIKNIKDTLDECTESEEAVCYVTDVNAPDLEMAIKALEKQIPKKPRFYAHNYYCSVCDNLVGNNEFEWQRFKYCDVCGQKLDWSNEE